jgi:hypothetical protein
MPLVNALKYFCIFIIEYLREYEFIFETTLAHVSGDPGVLFAEKIEGRKSRATVPLTSQNSHANIARKYKAILPKLFNSELY